MRKNMFLLYFVLAIINFIFAVNGRGRLYYVVAGLFLVAGIMGLIARNKLPKP